MSWNLLDEAQKIIAIHSVTYESNKEIVDYVMSLLKPLHGKVDLHEDSLYGKKQYNLIATWGEGDRGLLLNTHLDTVSPGDFSLWDKTGGSFKRVWPGGRFR